MRSSTRLVTGLLLAAVLSTAPAFAADAPAAPGSIGQALAGQRILHIAAHPDDEAIFAPMLAEACRFNGATCHLVVAQDADSYGCLRTIGLADTKRCSAIRRKEVAASAANLDATHEFYGFREGMYNWNDAGVRSNLAALEEEAGGREALVARFRRTLDEFRPDVVLGFDPRHGTSCHPNHRAVLQLAIEAIGGLPPERRPQVWLDSDYAVPWSPPPDPGLQAVIDGFGLVRWPGDEATPVTWYDANVALPDGRTAYDYAVDALRLNATQFPEVATGKLTPAPDPEFRRIPMVRLQDIDPNAQGMCEAYTRNAPDFEALAARYLQGRDVPDIEGFVKAWRGE